MNARAQDPRKTTSVIFLGAIIAAFVAGITTFIFLQQQIDSRVEGAIQKLAQEGKLPPGPQGPPGPAFKIGIHESAPGTPNKHFITDTLLTEGQQPNKPNEVEWRNGNGKSTNVFRADRTYSVWAMCNVDNKENYSDQNQTYQSRYLGEFRTTEKQPHVDLGATGEPPAKYGMIAILFIAVEHE
jgi:hypothetical protein